MRLKKFAAMQGPSQESLKTNEEPETPEPQQQQAPEIPAPALPQMPATTPPETEIRPVM
jgi:hypothetical protein